MSENNEIINDKEEKQINNIVSPTKGTMFKNLYKNLKVEISEKVMNKLLLKVDILEKENEKLRNENKGLKNHLIYLLRKILLNKIDYSQTTINDSRSMSKSSFIIKNQTTKSLMGSTKNLDVNNSYCNSFYKFPENQNSSIIHPITRNKSIEQKINSYLNSIYRHNFNSNNSGISIEKCMSSKDSLFNDLMNEVKKNDNNNTPKKNYNTITHNLSTGSNGNKFVKNKIKHFPTINKINIIRKTRKLLNEKNEKILNTESNKNENKAIIDKKKNKEIIIKKKKNVKSKIVNNNKIKFKSPYLTNKY
jgi:hypothetical protein